MPKNVIYHIVWVEGLSWKKGEKLKSFNPETFERTYTTSMTEALRVKNENLISFKEKLRKAGIAEFVIDNPGSFPRVSYAPRNTIWKPR